MAIDLSTLLAWRTHSRTNTNDLSPETGPWRMHRIRKVLGRELPVHVDPPHQSPNTGCTSNESPSLVRSPVTMVSRARESSLQHRGKYCSAGSTCSHLQVTTFRADALVFSGARAGLLARNTSRRSHPPGCSLCVRKPGTALRKLDQDVQEGFMAQSGLHSRDYWSPPVLCQLRRKKPATSHVAL